MGSKTLYNNAGSARTAYKKMIFVLGTGVMSVGGDVQAPIFYDLDSTTYYANPASRSNFGSLDLNSGAVWDATTQGTSKGALHLDPGSTTDHAGGAITFGASDTSNGTTAHAGIYVRSDGSYGTRMYLSTTDSYATGSKTTIRLEAAGGLYVDRGNMYAPIYYDKNDTNYYLDPASDSVLARADINGGANYPLQTSSSQRYMIQARNTGNSTNANYGWWWYMDTDFDMGFHADGAGDRLNLTRGGSLSSTLDMRSPIFYDSNNTGYYVDPNAGSKLVYLGLAADPNSSGSYRLNMGGSIDMNNNSIDYVNQLHFNDNVRFYDDGNDSYLNYVSGDSNTTGIKFYSNAGNSFRGYVYGETNGFGLLDSDGNWSVRIPLGGSGLELRSNNNVEFTVNDDHTISHGSMRAPIFYDSNDTNYYVNPAGTSILNDVEITQIAINEYLYHRDDTDTYLRFRGNRQTYVAGGVEFIDFKIQHKIL